MLPVTHKQKKMDFKPIRNKIKTFTFESITNEILAILKLYEQDNQKQRFWHPLILLKWNLEFSDRKYKVKIATRQDILKLLKQIDDLELSHNTFNLKKNSNISKTFTILAHQQFLYQEHSWWDSFARQLIIFKDLKHKYDISKSFKTLTNIELDVFLNISYIIWLTSFHSDITKIKYLGYIANDIQMIIIELFGKENLTKYLELLTVSESNVECILNDDIRILRNHNLQSFEPSFFTRKPFFFYKNKYIIPHKDILHHNFNYFIYEFLKSKDGKFTTELGHRMEKYMRLGLDEIEIEYKTEENLKSILGNKNSLVDFLIEDNILVEAKAIEVKPYVGINPMDDILANEFRKNLVKAYAKQMISVANKLNNNKEYFGIIVTYKKLFLGNSYDVWEQFLKAETLKICSSEDLLILPFENVFFMDIYTWDYLIQVLRDNDTSLIDILKMIKRVDSEPKTKKFSFHMHLEDEFDSSNFELSYLKDANERIKPNNASV